MRNGHLPQAPSLVTAGHECCILLMRSLVSDPPLGENRRICEDWFEKKCTRLLRFAEGYQTARRRGFTE